jgi:hypothetical protein
MSGGMSLVHDTPSSVLFRYQGRTAVLLFFVFAGAAVAVSRLVPDTGRWIFTFAFGFFAVILAAGSLWREELELSLASGQWRQRRGWVLSGAREKRGALDEIPEVELVLDRKSSSEDSSPTWQVRIQAPAWPSPVIVASSSKEEKGYAELEAWAKRLRKDAVDRTGDQERRTAWGELDQPLATAAVAPIGTPATGFADAALAEAYAPRPRVSEHPPAGSRIVVTSEKGRRRIVLPAIGFNTGVVAFALFGLVFGGFGAVFALVASTVIPNVRVNGEIPTAPVWPMVIMGSVFALIGVLIMVAPAVGARTREWIEDGSDVLVVGYSGIGFTWGVKRIPKRSIESIDLSASPTAQVGMRERKLRALGRAVDDDPRDLRIRTDAQVLRVGRYLTAEELRWFRDRVEAMVRG